ncbi:putative F-box domain-containing protein [Helianthus annuus]|uniref:F-box domain-containing protein n=1 Tax=Helianthus annuus TaxID=4232 RepID=A0A9K3E0J7_HELAN|nr:putative F-box domain-containing protein [Helianthus annuus]KAJ0451457.1 putative F-box domain-containing protein [Helianthus annuus]KAJ0473334.1 putative F-box domain-containing protein [Helianthus annuus]KAJ0648916.1 putative F-box domain-containing protein [Helianthus annuus]KAJ0652723.1 putative F-box domain-containing protein [Helianthus annuus]
MSDNLPFELQEEIMKRLPVRSLIQFRSVSKSWKSLISSSRFVVDYSGQQQHLFVMHEDDSDDFNQQCVSIVDDHTFPHQRVSVTIPPLVKNLKDPSIVGGSHGLLCLYDFDLDAKEMEMAVLWNPSIRKAVAVTNDPKIIKINHIKQWKDVGSINCIPSQVEVFTLSTGAWRSSYSSNLPRKSIIWFRDQVVIDGIHYWLATDRTSDVSLYDLIISFDITNEEFKEVILPDSLSRNFDQHVMSNLKNSLVMLEFNRRRTLYNVWMMEDGVSKSFTKLFTICPPDVEQIYVLEFRKSGEPVIQVRQLGGAPDGLLSLAVYEPDSKHINDLGIDGFHEVKAYTETLLLLDKPNFFIYENTTPAFEA